MTSTSFSTGGLRNAGIFERVKGAMAHINLNASLKFDRESGL